MSRALLGKWADGVEDDTLAAALLEAMGDAHEWAAPFAAAPELDAKTLAASWRAREHGLGALELPLGPREIATGADLAWLAWLLAHDPSVACVAFITAPPAVPSPWMWPLGIAIFDDAPGKALRAELSPVAFTAGITMFRAALATSPIEVLVDPGPLKETSARLEASGALPRVQTLIVLDDGGATILEADFAREQARADAVVVVAVPAGKRAGYFSAVLDLLPFQRLDEALASVAAKQGFHPPLIAACRDGLARASIATWASNLADHAETLSPAAVRGGPAPQQLQQWVDQASAVPDGFGDILNQLTSAGQDARGQPTAVTDERYLQAELRDGKTVVTTAPLAARTYALDVWIGAAGEGPLIAPAVFALTSTVEEKLQVVMTAPQLGDPVIRELTLPVSGDSARATFDLAIPATVDELELRIAVLHAQRVVQTVVLRAPIGNGDKRPLALALEGVIARDLGQLAGRRPFDAALIANQLAGKPSVSVFARDRASVIAADAGIDKYAREIGTELAKVTNNESKYGKPDTKPTTELLATLARKGVLFRDALLDQPQVRDDLGTAKRIQIIAAKPEQETLPIELCYDGLPPDDGAAICPGWKDSLASGACTVCAADQAKVVCPVRFWGLSRTIERHAYTKLDAAELGANAYALQSEPGASRARIPIVNGALCAAAKAAREVDPRPVDAAFDAAGDVVAPRDEVASWADWKAKIGATNPSLLVLLSHSDAQNGVGILVIADEQKLFVSSIDASYVGIGGGVGPIVMLLGCSTAANTLAYQSFVGRFRRGGASIVIGTLCEVLGRQAGAVAGALLGALKTASRAAESTPLGELMSAIRRDLLAKGLPIILAVTSYGDADWRI